MPELPEVETVCRVIAPKILGEKITKVIIRKPKLRLPIPKQLTKIINGKNFFNISRRGKYILLETNIGTLIIHLGMSGTLQTKLQKEPLEKHEHFIINFDKNLSLRYQDPRRFGAIIWTTKNPLEHPALNTLGLEPLTKDFNADYLSKQAKNRTIPIKQFIMDNNIVTGIGNIYANEILFAASINPFRKTNTIILPEFKKISQKTKQILKLAIKHRGTTIRDHTDGNGKKGEFQKKLKIYGKQNQPCPKCKTKLSLSEISQRVTVFCERCQKMEPIPNTWHPLL